LKRSEILRHDIQWYRILENVEDMINETLEGNTVSSCVSTDSV